MCNMLLFGVPTPTLTKPELFCVMYVVTMMLVQTVKLYNIIASR